MQIRDRECGSMKELHEFGGAASMICIMSFVLAFHVMKESKQSDDRLIRSIQPTKLKSVTFDVPPMIWSMQRPVTERKVGNHLFPQNREVYSHYCAL